MSELSLRRDPIRLVLSRGLWRSVWYLLGYLAVGWVLFAIAAAATIRWCADVERARLRQAKEVLGRPGPLSSNLRA